MITFRDKQSGKFLGRVRGQSLAGLDLRKACLAGMNLSGLDLSHCDLRGVSLIGCNLCGTKFYKANLEGAEVFGHQIDDATLIRLQQPTPKPVWRVRRKKPTRPQPRLLVPVRPPRA